MELIIDIPEELKNKIDNANENNYKTYLRWFETTLYCAIKNGTPLPEGHGRLVDMSEVLITLMQYYDGDKSIGQCLDEVHTVIKADGGDAE